MEALETGQGLPSPHMNWWDRLGLPPGAKERQIKKAYYQLSLIWHPDRWAAYPLYQSLAQDTFEVISEAYRMLTNPPAEEDKPPTNPTPPTEGAYS